jgi:diguanylate cyclase (GGDEF)-like protein
MSAVAPPISASPRRWTPLLPSLRLPTHARVYLGAIVATAAAAGAVASIARPPAVGGWGTFALLTVFASVAQLYIVAKPGNQSYRTTIAFLVAAAILLRPDQIVLLTVFHYIPSWLKHRWSWQPLVFNIGNTMLATLGVWGVFQSLHATTGVRFLGAGLVGCLVFVAANHLMLAEMLHLANGTPVRATKLFGFESVATDLALAATGVAIACPTNRWAIVFPLAPLFLIQRSLHVPQLEVEARLDPKTGLLNAREFEATLRGELERADRTGAPLTLLMADLDHLREINNAYGHLAGDAVLAGVANVFRDELRRHDIPARFGGEEFAIILPATTPAEARAIAERIRIAVAATAFEAETAAEPLHVTISLGVAGYPHDAADARSLVHTADVAVYQAKAGGRDRVVSAVC